MAEAPSSPISIGKIVRSDSHVRLPRSNSADVPCTVSALILGASLVRAITAREEAARLALPIVPAHQHTTQPSQHAPTPTHKVTLTKHK